MLSKTQFNLLEYVASNRPMRFMQQTNSMRFLVDNGLVAHDMHSNKYSVTHLGWKELHRFSLKY